MAGKSELFPQNESPSGKKVKIDPEGSRYWLPTEVLAPVPTRCDFFFNYVESCKGRGKWWGEVKALIVANPAEMMMKALKCADVESRQMCL